MESAVIVTHRCNARCRMCYSWRSPTQPEEEFDPEILRKIRPRIESLYIPNTNKCIQ
jgi:MoaA/NifB/PqqE/SkfB family radical SAM enzyme